MNKDPAFLMYSKDWLEGTAEYMPDEKGVYIDLLCHQHQKGSLPNDLDRLARMVGISNGNFLKIWNIISCHFDQVDNRLVNRKLQNLMNERKGKSKLNTITGTFAGLLRLGNYTSKEYKHLKAGFKPSDFIKYSKEEITDRLTEWLVLWLKSIGNANEDLLSSSNIIKEEEEKEIKEKEIFDIFRKVYPGTKKGLNIEFENFIKQHKDWEEILPLLSDRLKYQKEARQVRKENKLFIPEWKNLKTWINQRCWEDQINLIE